MRIATNFLRLISALVSSVAAGMLTISLLVFLYSLTVAHVVGAGLELNQPCNTPSGRHGRCIPVRNCSFVVKIFRSQVSIADGIYLEKFRCGKLPVSGKALVCCPELRSEENCGDLTLITRILGGEETDPEEFPWMALLGFQMSGERIRYRCGGTLINEQYVITAAHCLDKFRDRKLAVVRLGEWDLDTAIDCPDDSDDRCFDGFNVDYPIEKVIVHEKYSLKNLNMVNDIALVKLENTVERTKLVAPICVPTPEMDGSLKIEGKSFVVSGWGETETGHNSRRKMQVTLTGQTIEKCNQAYAAAHVTFTESQLCVGGVRGQDSCKGDSGGPLMTVMDGRWHLVGIVSVGTNHCGTHGMPSIYTRFGTYLDWVAGKIELENRVNLTE